MKTRVRPLVVVCALLMIIGLLVFAAACGSSGPTTSTAAPATTTAAPATTTTAAPAAGATSATAAGATGTTTAAADDNSGTGTSGTIQITGLVDKPSTITVVSLQAMHPVTITANHPKLGPTQYTGVRFSALLPALGVKPSATLVDLYCSDGYVAEVSLADIKASADSMIAIGKDGTINAVMPGMTGKAWASDIVTMQFK